MNYSLDLKPVVRSVNHADVAIIYDFQNEWALNLAQLPRNEDKNYQERCLAHFRQFWQKGITIDIINSSFTDLSNYQLLVAPMLYLLQEGVAERWLNMCKPAAHLIATYLTGLVNQSDLVFMGGAPGPLKKLLGIWVEETDVLFDHHQQTIRVTRPANGQQHFPVKAIRRHCASGRCQILAVYKQDFYAGSPAITVNHLEGGAHIILQRVQWWFSGRLLWLAGC